MQETITFIISYRNREPIKVKQCLESLSRQSNLDFSLKFVDYGSDKIYSKQVQKIVEGYSFGEYLYSDTRGYPWSRSKALNIGIRNATSEYILTTDVDMVFAGNFVDTALQHAHPHKVINCAPFWLPKRFKDWENIDKYRGRFPIGDNVQLGGCQCIPTELIQEIKGFDEYYRYWGLEDRDMNFRLQSLGLNQKWINDETSIYHQWHPKENYLTNNFIPIGLWGRMTNYLYLNRSIIIRNSDKWGEIIKEKERPVYKFIDFQNHCLISGLSTFHQSPYSIKSTGYLVEEFWKTPENVPLVIHNVSLPQRRQTFDKALWWINHFLWKAQLRVNLNFGTNILYTYLDEFIEYNSKFISDYYLNFPMSNGLSILIRK